MDTLRRSEKCRLLEKSIFNVNTLNYSKNNRIIILFTHITHTWNFKLIRRKIYIIDNIETDTYPSMTNSRSVSQLDHWTARAVLLFMEFRLIWFEHADLAPPVKEQRNGRHPQYHHAYHNERLLGPYYDRA